MRMREILSPEEEGWVFLETMHSMAAERGEKYFLSRRVLSVEETKPLCFKVMVRGSEVYTVRLDFDQRCGWDAECSCPLGYDCKHIFAALRTLLQSPEVLRERPNGKPNRRPGMTQNELSFTARVRQACGGTLTAEQNDFLGRLQRLHGLCRQRGAIYAVDFTELGLPLDSSEAGPLTIWPEIPPKLKDFWLHIAGEAEEHGHVIPSFMEAVTNTAELRPKLRRWRRENATQRWRQTLADAGRATGTETPGRCELRICFQADRAVLEWKRHGEESFSPIKPAQGNRLAADIAEGVVELQAEDELLWNSFCTPYDYGQDRIQLSCDEIRTAKRLKGLFRMPAFDSRLVNAEGNPFRRSGEELKWCLKEAADEEGDYRLQILRADGSPPPEVLFVLEGQPTLFVTRDTIFPGPRVIHGSLAMNRENIIPAPALETRSGAQFLNSIGVELPPRLRKRVQRIPLRLCVICELEGRHNISEQCVIRLATRTADGNVVDYGAEDGWRSQERGLENRKEPADGPIILYDRSGVLAPPVVLQGLPVKWDGWFGRWTMRVTRKFGEVFGRWLETLPASAKLELKGELAGFGEKPIVGSVRLDVSESESEIDWFDLRVVLDLADVKLSEEEINLLLNARGGYVRLPKKGWTRLQVRFSEDDEAQLARLGLTSREFTGEPQRLHALQLADAGAKRFLPAEQYQKVQRRADELKARVTPEIPAGVKAELRPYQKDGYHFLAYLAENRFGGILADDMGLGKTLQTLTWLLWLRGRAKGAEVAPALVVCPKSVMDNWRAESERFAPELCVRVWKASELEGFRKSITEADLHVINYAQLRTLGDQLAGIKWLAAVLDEGQYIKNPGSMTARIACSLRAEHRLVLTGTPIENRLLDLWSLMAFAMPGILGKEAQFARLYDAKGDPLARRRLSARVRPFLLRRAKGQVARDLPERIEEDLLCEIEGEQRTLYRAELKRAQQMLLAVKTQQQLAKQQFNFLTSLLRLRQICCDAKLVNAESKAASAKMEALMEQLEPLIEEGHKVLVFSQFVDMLKIIRGAIAERGWQQFYLSGETENRGELVEQFQDFSGPAVFLISLKAGGFGLNLTAASYVILFDPWWNPAVENQAIDRTHRIGQKQNVIAYRLLVKDSIEDKIRALQKRKSALAEDVLGEEKFAQSLTLEDLRYLLSDSA
jgi:SNF2 family DNA or RNA helicase